MVRLRSRALIVPAAILAALSLVTACGGKDDGTKADAGASTSSTPTSTPDPAAAAFMTRVTAGFATYSTVHMKISSAAMLNAEGDVDYGGSTPKIRMTLDLGAGPQQMVLADGAVYMQQGAGGKYTELDTSDPTYGTLLGSLGGFSPDKAVSGIGPAITKVTKKGVATVGGTRVTEYAITLDGSKVEGALASIVGSGSAPSTVTATFALDRTGLLRRMVADVSGQELTLTLSGWGEKVDIAAPGKDELLNP